MNGPTPRRRADDWKEDSPRKFLGTFFTDMATKLGYEPSNVMSIRVNQNEAVVTYRMPSGMPRSARHELVKE